MSLVAWQLEVDHPVAHIGTCHTPTCRQQQKSILSDDESLSTEPPGMSPPSLMPAEDPHSVIRDVRSMQEAGYENTHILLGDGAESRVMRFKSPEGASVAVKIISKEQHPAHRVYTQEVSCLRRLGNHPSVVQCLDALQTPTEVFIVTEEFGVDLDKWQSQLKAQINALPGGYVESIRHVTWQLLKAVKDLHNSGVVHRDIKLHNILIHMGYVKLIDFGAAAMIPTNSHEVMPLTFSIKGTLGYLPPEVLKVAASHTFTGTFEELTLLDTFALGCVIYQLLYGRPPFRVSDLGDVAKGQPDPFAVKSTALLSRMQRPPPFYPRGLGNTVIDADVKELLGGLLHLDKCHRWNVETALQCKWLTKTQ